MSNVVLTRLRQSYLLNAMIVVLSSAAGHVFRSESSETIIIGARRVVFGQGRRLEPFRTSHPDALNQKPLQKDKD
jgi:hypothetical protein